MKKTFILALVASLAMTSAAYAGPAKAPAAKPVPTAAPGTQEAPCTIMMGRPSAGCPQQPITLTPAQINAFGQLLQKEERLLSLVGLPDADVLQLEVFLGQSEAAAQIAAVSPPEEPPKPADPRPGPGSAKSGN